MVAEVNLFLALHRERRHSWWHSSVCLQGNCQAAVPDLGISGAAMLPVQPQQCVVITDRRMMDTAPDSDMLWVDGLYMRYQRSPAVQTYNAGVPRR